GEPGDDVALAVPVEVERTRLVVPFDLVEVQQAGELALAGVRKGNEVAGEGFGRGALAAQAPPALVIARGARAAGFAALAVAGFRSMVFPSEPERSAHTASRAMANTPWPRRNRSMTSSSDSHA